MENSKSKYDVGTIDIHDNIYSKAFRKYHHLYEEHAGALIEDIEYLDAITARYAQPFYEITLGLVEPDNPIKVSIIGFDRKYEEAFFSDLLKNIRTTNLFAWILGFDHGYNGNALDDGHGFWEFNGDILKLTNAGLNQLVEYSTAIINMKLSDLHKNGHLDLEHYSLLVNFFLIYVTDSVVNSFSRGFGFVIT